MVKYSLNKASTENLEKQIQEENDQDALVVEKFIDTLKCDDDSEHENMSENDMSDSDSDDLEIDREN